jgi:hypothetical protein
LQLVADEEFIEMKKNTRFGKITQGTDYAAYSIDNKFLLDNNTFIDRKTGSAKYYFTMKYNGTTFGIWIDRSVSKMFVSYDVEPTCRIIYSITLDDHSPNTMLLKSISKAVLFKTFIDNYNMGNVYFENINIKNIVYDIIRKVMAYS